MNSDADKIIDRAIGNLRSQKGFSPLTPKEAEAAYEAAPAIPLSTARIDEIVRFATSGSRSKGETRPSSLSDWSKRFPLKDMRRLRFSLPQGRSDADTLLDFFGASSPESWQAKWEAAPVAFRQTKVFEANEEAVAAWVREAEIIAGQIPLAEFDEDSLRSSLDELRQLTRKRADAALELAQQICSRTGVAVVLIPDLPGTRISGCARWLSDAHALLGLTLRYKTDDQLWFTFFHEVAHILLHRGQQLFVVDNAAENVGDAVVDPQMVKIEDEANRFAADTLIPPSALTAFVSRKTFTNDSIHEFAESIGIGPGIVVGRLQRDGVLKRHQGNKLKQKLDWKFATEG